MNSNTDDASSVYMWAYGYRGFARMCNVCGGLNRLFLYILGAVDRFFFPDQFNQPHALQPPHLRVNAPSRNISVSITAGDGLMEMEWFLNHK